MIKSNQFIRVSLKSDAGRKEFDIEYEDTLYPEMFDIAMNPIHRYIDELEVDAGGDEYFNDPGGPIAEQIEQLICQRLQASYGEMFSPAIDYKGCIFALPEGDLEVGLSVLNY